MDNTRAHPLVKLTARGCKLAGEDDDAPQFKAQLRRSQIAQLECLLRWLDAAQRDRKLNVSALIEHKRTVDRICQDLYERGGWL
jgi:hypothetical protein